MKKSLIALAALAVVGAASAQVTGGVPPTTSSVTLFGIVDTAVEHVSNRGAGAANGTRMVASGKDSTRIGFRGAEDLGGGMFASFWLEAGFNGDNGTGAVTNTNNQANGTSTPLGTSGAVPAGTQGLTFNRRATVALVGGFGEVRLGRDYAAQFWNLTHFDPFGTNGVGTTQTLLSLNGGNPINSTYVSNSLSYFTPGNLGGFFGHAQYYLGENTSTTVSTAAAPAGRKDGTGAGLRVGYVSGPLAVAISTGRTERSTLAGGDLRQSNLAGSWDFGVAKIMGQLTRDRFGPVDGKGWLLGAVVPVGAGEIKASMSRYITDVAVGTDPRATKLAVGYVHNLSKRTQLYTTYARVRNNGTSAASVLGSVAGTYGGFPTAGSSSSGYDLGVRHAF